MGGVNNECQAVHDPWCDALFLVLSGAPAMSEEKSQQHIQIAEIVVDPAQLEATNRP